MQEPDPLEAFSVVREVIRIFDALGVPCVIGGSVASSAWGFPRSTRDVDVVTRLRGENVSALLESLGEDYYSDETSIRDAIARHSSFNMIHLETVIKIDVFIPGHEAGAQAQIDRAQIHELSTGIQVPLVAPEDIILQKLRWYRLGGEASSSQWLDVRSVLKVRGNHLDSDYLTEMAESMGLRDLLDRAIGEARE